VAVAYASSTSFSEGDTGTNITGLAKPASTAIGDVLVLQVYKEDTGASASPASTGDSWTTVHEIDNTTPTPDFRFSVHICVVANASSTITISNTNAGWRDCAVHRFTGVDTTTPQDTTATENQGTSTTVTGTGLTTATNGAHLVLCTATFDGRTHASWTAPLTERNDSGNVAMASGDQASAGASGNKTATITSSSWTAIMLALRPAGGGGATLTATATPSITLSLAPAAIWVARAQATPSITLRLSASAGERASPGILLSLAATALKIAPATASPSITLALAPVALKIGLAQATPSITLALAPIGLGIALGQATPSITLLLGPTAVAALAATASPSITLVLSASVPGVVPIEAHTVSPPGLAITDSFDRADDAASLGTADTSEVWTAHVGTWGVSGNKAIVSGAASNKHASLDSGASNVTVRATLSPVDASQSIGSVGLLFRAQGADNGLLFVILPSGETARLLKIVDGVATIIATADYTPNTSSTLTVTCSGTTIDCYVDGALVIHATGVTDFQGETQHGLYASGSPATTWDDFSISASPTPTITLTLSPTAQRISTGTIYTVRGTTNRQGLREAAIAYRGSR
jgi:hypothetical protein